MPRLSQPTFQEITIYRNGWEGRVDKLKKGGRIYQYIMELQSYTDNSKMGTLNGNLEAIKFPKYKGMLHEAPREADSYPGDQKMPRHGISRCPLDGPCPKPVQSNPHHHALFL